ncbi:MAG: glutaredoxin family protein [Candidatus Poribacteria bacterium]|nr:glutaredoxin family protein [Candidatus Poribacteria bacterium]
MKRRAAVSSGQSALTKKENGKEALLLEIYGKEECPLCDKAERAVNETLRKLDGIPIRLVKHDIERDAALFERYQWLIPVVHLNGEQAALYRVNKRALTKRIRRAWKSVR